MNKIFINSILREFWTQRARSLLVILSLAIGIFAVGATAGAQSILEREMRISLQTVSRTNSAGTTGRTTTAGCVSTASATSGIVLNSGNAANKYGPFLPLAAGDTGVKDIESLAWGGTAHASGSVFIGLCKPLCMPIPVPATGLYNLVDFVNTVPSLPRLRNGANVTFLVFATGATTSGGTVYANFDYAYGG